MTVTLRNPRTGETRDLQIGWSWICLFFASLFGVPLFMRRLYILGAIGVVSGLLNFAAGNSIERESDVNAVIVVGFLQIVFAVFSAAFANRLAGRKYLRTGWEFAEPSSEEARAARESWGVANRGV